MFARNRCQFAQRRDIAIHREHAVAREQCRAIGMRRKLACCAIGIVVRITLQRAAGQFRGIDQRGVVELVLHAGIAFAQQRLQHREVGQVSAAEQQRAFALQPVGKRDFQRRVLRVVPADQMRCGCARACTRRIAQRRDQLRMLRQAEVVVAAEVQQRASIDHAVHAIAAGDRARMTPPLHRLALRARCGHSIMEAQAWHLTGCHPGGRRDPVLPLGWQKQSNAGSRHSPG